MEAVNHKTEARQNEHVRFFDNCFGLIRVLAALSVFLEHALVHLNIQGVPGALSYVYGFFYGVPIFFFLSGFLLWAGLQKEQSFSFYIQKRLLRLYPELILCVLVSVISILVLYHEPLNYGQFALYVLGQSSFVQFWTPDCLRLFGCGVPNGSLWTIGVMAQSYVAFWLFFKIMHHKKTGVWIAVLTAFMALSVAYQYSDQFLPTLLYKLLGQTFLPYFWIYVFGAMLSEYRDTFVPFLKKTWFLFGAISAACMFSPFSIGAYPLLRCSALFLFVVGFGYFFHALKIHADVSYGIYLYHMVVINVFIEINFVGQFWQLFIALLITILLSLGSYYSVGLLSRKIKQKLVART